MKPLPPQLQDQAGLDGIGPDRLQSGESFESVRLEDADVSAVLVPNLSFAEAVFGRVTFTGAKLEKLDLSDVRAKACDFSAANVAEASFLRVYLSGCRMSGVDLSRSTLQDVVFDNCKLDMANLRSARLKRVMFVNCQMHETDFLDAGLQDVSFQSSHLEKTEFARCKLKNVDARTSELLDIRGWEFLKGLKIDQTQLAAIAPQLALALGLEVDD